MSRRGRILRSGVSEKGRVETFSDGVFAIVMTLIFVEIQPPVLTSGRDPWAALALVGPALAAAALSFVFLLWFWIAHHYLFQQMRRVDRGALWLNGAFLLSVCIIPYPTTMEARMPGAAAPTVLLSATMAVSAILFSLLRAYASFVGEVFGPHNLAARRSAMRRSLIAPIGYAIATVAGFKTPPVSLALLLLVPLIYLFPSRLEVGPEGA